MKLSEILASRPIRVQNDVYELAAHVTEIDWYGINTDAIAASGELELRYHIESCPDGIRCRDIFSVWLHDEPVLICFDGGRDGRDDRHTYFLSKNSYITLMMFLLNFSGSDGWIRATPLSHEVDTFYGQPLTSDEFIYTD